MYGCRIKFLFFPAKSQNITFQFVADQGQYKLQVDRRPSSEYIIQQQAHSRHILISDRVSRNLPLFSSHLRHCPEVIHLVNIKRYVPTIDLYHSGCVINPPTNISASCTCAMGIRGRWFDFESKSRSYAVKRILWMKTTIHGQEIKRHW